MPIGTFTKKIHSQLSMSVSTPPSSSPNAPPPAAIALQTPIAFVRSSSANVVVMIDSAAGETSAPPSPCSPRAATSHVSLVASPLRSDANEKTATPQRKRFLLPSRSGASGRKPPKISV
jgi:hypothetical protein